MDTLRAMRMFVMVVQSGSLSSAGRKIGMSPASISRYINALEDNVGSRLLNRSSRKLTLTDAGEIYFRYVEQILNQIEEVHSNLSQLQHSPRGTLRVHSRILIATQQIIPAMPRFMALYPDIKIDLMISNNVIDLVEQNVDVDIRIGELQDSSLIARKLVSSERVLCASPGYLARSAPITSPQDLAQHNCLSYRVHMGGTTWRFADQDGAITEIPIQGSFQTDNGPALRTLALADAGIILMPDWSVMHDLRAGTLVSILPGYRVSYGSFDNGVYAVYQQSRHLSAKVRAFVDFLAALLREQFV
ncbi:Transcriptional regulator, LysR family [Hyphomicrobiales bacterium]|nr:Transcriptional regulator, LysR family [Hyphomicrobiales bacterium]CAH1691434.1 Transcriptional regulator, LysR family [Hyphomicrobiales bacterium]